MQKFTYKNTSGQEQVLMGVGVVKKDAEVELDFPLENPNFEQLKPTGKRLLGVDPVTETPKK